jgi:hypothetical protein
MYNVIIQLVFEDGSHHTGGENSFSKKADAVADAKIELEQFRCTGAFEYEGRKVVNVITWVADDKGNQIVECGAAL